MAEYTISKIKLPNRDICNIKDTTYTFENGTNEFKVTPLGGTAQTVTVTPNITNNITGSGTSGYLAKFNGANTITSGPQLGNNTTTFLRNDGTWIAPPYPVIKVAGNTGDISADTLRASLGLSNAMHFLGVTTTNVSTGIPNTTATVSINDSNVTAAAGDVVLYGSQEYVWGNDKWNLLGDESSYKVKQTAKSDPTASTTTSTTFIDTISQDANGVITATKKTLPSYVPISAGVTAVTWDSTNKKITRTINGSAADVLEFAADNNISLTAASDKLTISLADGYGDTKNPYASKTKNYVLASGTTADSTPSFRALVAADIPTLSITDKTSGILPLERGGTGAETAAAARTNLGITPANIGAVNKAGDTMTGPLTFDTNMAIWRNTAKTRRWLIYPNAAGDEFYIATQDLDGQGAASNWRGVFVAHSDGSVAINKPLPITSGGTGQSTEAGMRSTVFNSTDTNGITTYPTEPGLYRVTKSVTGLPSGLSNYYGVLMIYGAGSYYNHVYIDSNLNQYFAYKGSTGAPASWKQVLPTSGGTITGTLTVNSTLTQAAGQLFSAGGSIEMHPSTSAGYGGFIDFHYNNDSSDYTERIIGYNGNITMQSKTDTNMSLVIKSPKSSGQVELRADEEGGNLKLINSDNTIFYETDINGGNYRIYSYNNCANSTGYGYFTWQRQKGTIDIRACDNPDYATAPSTQTNYNILTYRDTAGNQRFNIYSNRTTDGTYRTYITTGNLTNGYNQISIGITTDGTCVYSVSDDAAFRNTIKAVYKAGDTMTGDLTIKQATARTYLHLTSVSDQPVDIRFSNNNAAKWALSSRSSSDSNFFGLFNHMTSAWPIKVSNNDIVTLANPLPIASGGTGATSANTACQAIGATLKITGATKALLYTALAKIAAGTTIPYYTTETGMAQYLSGYSSSHTGRPSGVRIFGTITRSSATTTIFVCTIFAEDGFYRSVISGVSSATATWSYSVRKIATTTA